MVAFWTVMLFVLGFGYLIAFTRKGSVRTATMGSRQHELFVPGNIDEVFARIAALDGKFKVDDQDPSSKIVVLSSPVTFGTWGFLYPVFLHAQPGGTRIQIGCHSKFIQLGPLVTKSHNECRDAIEAALSVPEARVA